MEKEDEALRALTVILKASTSITNLLKKDMNSYGMNATEFMVLELLYNKGPQPVQVIGNKVLLASSSINYVINQLEKKNYVKRERNMKDRRVIFVSLTAKGMKLMDEIFPKHRLIIQDLFNDLSDEKLVEITNRIKKVGYKAGEIYENIESEG